jgi:hypothetical protein
MSRHLIEKATDMIEAHLIANLPTALADIASDRALNDIYPDLALAVPQEYFVDSGYEALNTPSVFIVCDNIDFKKPRGANHINATASYGIAAIVENQQIEEVARQSWRYQSALSQVLDNTSLTNSDNTLSIKIIVQRAEFTEPYTQSTREGEPAAHWRKAALLRCDVEFYEAL